ncbi:hypothetical protein GGR62_003933 [Xanthomonas campestris]|nr:hypothetical protein [Xanthomonas sp. 3075]
MQALARTQRQRVSRAHRAEPARVIQCEAQSIDGPIEQQQQTVGAVDQSAAPVLLQFDHQPIVLAEQGCCGVVADAFDQGGGIA